MKNILVVIFTLFSGIVAAQNIGIGINTPTENLHVDSTIKIGKDVPIPDSSRKNLVKFGDGSYVTVGEEYGDDQMNIKFGNLIFSKSPGSNGNGYIGVFTNTPTANFDLNGSLRIRSGNAGANKVLTSVDGSGTADWADLPVAQGFTLPYAGSTSAIATAFDISQTGPSTSAANFQVTSTSNPANTLVAGSAGTGNSIYSLKSGTAGSAFIASSSNAANVNAAAITESYGSGDAIQSVARGTGIAGRFLINNTASSNNALLVISNGSGAPLFVGAATASPNIAVFQSNNSTVAQIDKTGKGFFNGGLHVQDGTQGLNKILISDASGNSSWSTGQVVFPGFRAYLTANTSVTSAVTTVTGYTETYDDAAAFNPATGIYTVPVAGLYSFTAIGGWGTTAVGSNVVYICTIKVVPAGGGSITVAETREPFTIVAGYPITVPATGELKLAVGDQVHLEVSNSFGSSITLTGGSSSITTSFMGHRVY